MKHKEVKKTEERQKEVVDFQLTEAELEKAAGGISGLSRGLRNKSKTS